LALSTALGAGDAPQRVGQHTHQRHGCVFFEIFLRALRDFMCFFGRG
jgi:hypothetical protein